MKVMSVVGARPNFMKVAPIMRRKEVEHILVHTGQHYDDAMSKTFFRELEIPEADYNLGVGSGSPGWQLGETMKRFEEILLKENPDWVLVYGDVNAVPAATITAKRNGFLVGHVEAGLRSNDKTMPEELNRVLADRVCDKLFTPCSVSTVMLADESIWGEIHMVGNIMIDTMERERGKAEDIELDSIAPGLEENTYTVMTCHRPSNVDDPRVLQGLFEVIGEEAIGKVVLPLHPRTEASIKKGGISVPGDKFEIIPPVTYRQMLRLNLSAAMMITDSGGLQEECCVLGTPCVVMRDTTERPVTLQGSCVLAGNNPEKVRREIINASNQEREPHRPPLWDGKTAERIISFLS